MGSAATQDHHHLIVGARPMVESRPIMDVDAQPTVKDHHTMDVVAAGLKIPGRTPGWWAGSWVVRQEMSSYTAITFRFVPSVR